MTDLEIGLINRLINQQGYIKICLERKFLELNLMVL